MELTLLSGMRKLPEYRQNRTHVFQSEGSLAWFVRQNRGRLIEAGALVLLAGTWHANEVPFDAVVLEVGEAAAKRRGVVG